jgi:hypothetical protein
VETVAVHVPENFPEELGGFSFFTRGAFCFGLAGAGVVAGLSMIGAGEVPIVNHKVRKTDRARATVVGGSGFTDQLPNR